eukprot:NODE_5612_length_690_cov_4.074883_g4742_i0.p1 GENE.NODE_5612_length_690_cov_4.074883_g4742_i0~~NODE_5612_length_690_cov_4.074883_g4742_i0.p1  ORF type:complete len:191 (-),score=19.12 NODE_5612_length_690_cov_4.074883_g4742_i0:116-643(-)
MIADETQDIDLPADLSPGLQELLSACFHRDPDQRPTVEMLLKHPFLTEETSPRAAPSPAPAAAPAPAALSASPPRSTLIPVDSGTSTPPKSLPSSMVIQDPLEAGGAPSGPQTSSEMEPAEEVRSQQSSFLDPPTSVISSGSASGSTSVQSPFRQSSSSSSLCRSGSANDSWNRR